MKFDGKVITGLLNVIPSIEVLQPPKGYVSNTISLMFTRFMYSYNPKVLKNLIWFMFFLFILFKILLSWSWLKGAKAIDNKKRNKYVGIRFGEKLHEELITKEESKYAYYNGKCYILKENIKKIKK